MWGVVRDAAAPTPGHQWIVDRFFLVLDEHLQQTGAGRVWMSPIDVVLDRANHLILQPDLIVVSAPRSGIVTDRVWGAPDLVIDILSPRPRIGTLDERIAWFARYGVRECWLVHQTTREVEVVEFLSGAVEQRQRFGPEASIRSRVLPDFNLSPGSSFDR